MGYATAMWLSFGTALATVAGALTGQLFVAVSVKSDVMAGSLTLRSRAAQTLVLFMTSVLIGVILDRRAGHEASRGVARYVEKFSPNWITAVLVGVAGITFVVKAGGGLYWLIPAAVASLLGGVINAWMFLVRLTG